MASGRAAPISVASFRLADVSEQDVLALATPKVVVKNQSDTIRAKFLGILPNGLESLLLTSIC